MAEHSRTDTDMQPPNGTTGHQYRGTQLRLLVLALVAAPPSAELVSSSALKTDDVDDVPYPGTVVFAKPAQEPLVGVPSNMSSRNHRAPLSWSQMPLGNGNISVSVWIKADSDLAFYVGKSDSYDETRPLQRPAIHAPTIINPHLTADAGDRAACMPTYRSTDQGHASEHSLRWVDDRPLQ